MTADGISVKTGGSAGQMGTASVGANAGKKQAAGEYPFPGRPTLEVPFLQSQNDHIEVDNVYVALDYKDDPQNTPGGAHCGIHYSPTKDYDKPIMTYRAMAPGRVTNVNVFRPAEGGCWNVNVLINYNDRYLLVYTFEPNSEHAAVGQTQMKNIAVAEGDVIHAGDIIGALHIPSPEKAKHRAMFHVHLIVDGKIVSFVQFLSPEALATSNKILHRDHPDWKLCYK